VSSVKKAVTFNAARTPAQQPNVTKEVVSVPASDETPKSWDDWKKRNGVYY
jgi:hypothetical protein